ncbi:MAG TPA: hypothetical protein VNN73_13280 [Blastocatellia bacterium]|nr:hypothetical protein [Blastocatellia bacterium]
MSADEFEKRVQRHIGSMLEQQARFDARQVQFDERLSKTEQVQAKTANDLQLFTGKVLEMTEAVSSTQSQLDSAIDKMREGFNKLIAANELTSSLIERLTLLEVQNSKRLTAVEQRVDKLEEKTQ